jgi:hypothetical protein
VYSLFWPTKDEKGIKAYKFKKVDYFLNPDIQENIKNSEEEPRVSSNFFLYL